MNRVDILSCAPPNIVLREVQIKALKWVQENWTTKNVMILNMPVGAGKSYCATTIAEWTRVNGLGNTGIITPSKVLQDQYAKDFENTPNLKGMDNYTCHATPAGNCKSTKRIFEKCCGPTCPYLVVRSACQVGPISLYNFHSYFYNEMWKKNVIIDEGHNVANFLFEMFSVKLWQPEWKFDKDIEPTIENVLEIVNAALLSLGEHHAIALSKKIESLIEEIEKEIMKYKAVRDTLVNFGKDVLIVKKEEEYHGKVVKAAKGTKQVLIHVKPLKVSSMAADILWPVEHTDRVILMSATVGMNDVKELGLDTREVGYFESDSPIPKERRPFVVIPVANMKYAAQDDSIPIIAKYLVQLAARHPDEKGLIHCTYSVAQKLQKLLGKDPRFWFHDKYTKNQQYQDFRVKKGNMILVASGMSEGIDLPDDAARWQVITKVAYPSLADDVNMWRCYNEPELYKWDTVRTIIQQSGRIVRNPLDYGITYILDMEFQRLWDTTGPKVVGGKLVRKGMWPEWFQKAMIWVKA